MPTRLVRGSLPTLNMLCDFRLDRYYGPLIKSFKSGNYKEFANHISVNSDFFRHRRLYSILLHRTKLIIFRNVFKNCYKISGNSKIPLEYVHSAFRFLNLDFSITDVECIAVSLIEQGYIRGYLVHKRSLLVLAKSQSFPQPYSIASKLG